MSSYLDRARAGNAQQSTPSQQYDQNDGNDINTPAPPSFDVIAHRERWDMVATVAYIRSLSPEKLAVYRAAVAFDAEALRQADADRRPP